MPLYHDYHMEQPYFIDEQFETTTTNFRSPTYVSPYQQKSQTNPASSPCVDWVDPSSQNFSNTSATQEHFLRETNSGHQSGINTSESFTTADSYLYTYNYLTPYFPTESTFDSDDQDWKILPNDFQGQTPAGVVSLDDGCDYLDQPACSEEQEISASPYPEFRNIIGPDGVAQSCFSNSKDASWFLNKAFFNVKHSSIPVSYAHNQIAIVEMFYNAMVSLEHVLDDSFEVKNFRNGRYSKEEIEAACWRLASLLYELHRPSETPINEARREHPACVDESLSFTERVNSLCEMLATRKTACGEIINADHKLLNIVRAPQAHNKRKTMNQRSNAQKAIKLRMANAQLANVKIHAGNKAAIGGNKTSQGILRE